MDTSSGLSLHIITFYHFDFLFFPESFHLLFVLPLTKNTPIEVLNYVSQTEPNFWLSRLLS